MLRDLPTQLRIDTMCFIHRNTIPRISIFRGQSNDFITTVLFLLKPQHHAKGSLVYNEGETAFEFFFVINGTLKSGHYLDHPRSEVITNNFKDGESFGQAAVITQTPRPSSVMATSRSHLLSLSRSAIDWLITRYPPWANILTNAMKEMYESEIKNVHWKKIRRSVTAMGLLVKGNKNNVLNIATNFGKKAKKSKTTAEILEAAAAAAAAAGGGGGGGGEENRGDGGRKDEGTDRGGRTNEGNTDNKDTILTQSPSNSKYVVNKE